MYRGHPGHPVAAGEMDGDELLSEECGRGMLTAEDYRQSIRDGRASYLEGRRIADPVTHPLLRVSVDWVASTYERTASAGPGARNPIFDQAATPAQLEEQQG